MKPYLSFIFLVLFTNSVFGQNLTNAKLDSVILETISKYHIPSMTVSLVMADSVYYGIQGHSRIEETKKIVQLTDKYHIGSNTKAFTSFLAFQAIEEGKIDLGAKFVDLYPELKKIRKEYKNITLSDLLSHNARIRAYTEGREFRKIPKFIGSVSEMRYEFAKCVLKQKPIKMGEYSNAGYVLAALMLEKVYNQPFEEILSSSMNKMHLKVYYGFPNREDINYPWGHWKEKNELISLSPDHNYKLASYMLPAGDLSINIIDYSKFIQTILNGVLGKDSALKQGSFQKILYDMEPYSYGWKNQINDKGKLAFHDGSTGTFYCHTLISSTYQFAIIIMMNTAEEEQIKGLYELRNVLFKMRSELRS